MPAVGRVLPEPPQLTAGICVLIVDDQPDVRLAFAFMLDALGCKVAEGADGREALQHLAKNRVDVVLTDLYMPRMDGVALIEAIRKRPLPHPKIIAMSGSENLAYRASLQAAAMVGADALLTKPIARAKLLNTIRDLTGGAVDQLLHGH